MRSEQAIFKELAALCKSKGFIHAIARFFVRDFFITFEGELKSNDMAKLYTWSRLVRTELTTLIGLMMRESIDFALPKPSVLSDYIEQSELLLDELHQNMMGESIKFLRQTGNIKPHLNQTNIGKFFREPIFYGGESAYSFQYRDLAYQKYGADSEWLLRNKGIKIAVAQEVCRSIGKIIDRRIVKTISGFESKPISECNLLPGFTFDCKEVAFRINKPIQDVRAFVEAFTLPQAERNTTFKSFGDFNSAYAFPFIRRGCDKFLLLQRYGLSEAFYETPFYWMNKDPEYAPIALRNRGEYTEEFAAERLTHVFGNDCVYRNVEILQSKGKTLGEIDILVIFGNRVIVLQAKSKRLTIEARKGNDRMLMSDFKAAVQNAVDQSFKCAEFLGNPSISLKSNDGRTIQLTESPIKIFPLTVVADHYPALASQAYFLLETKSTKRITPPMVADVFALDTITEMLSSPHRIMSYISHRTRFRNRLLANHENKILAHHLKYNLWVESTNDLATVDDEIASNLEVAMIARRDGISGETTPEGILTRAKGTMFEKIISQIESEPNPVAIDLGLLLLELPENTVGKINKLIEEVIKRTFKDGRLHDFPIGVSDASTGLTVHCSRLVGSQVEARLKKHCERKKYQQKADSWFGLALRPDGSIQLVVKLVDDWTFDPKLELLLRNKELVRDKSIKRRTKIGRNHPCRCGSGKKYKRCCLNR